MPVTTHATGRGRLVAAALLVAGGAVAIAATRHHGHPPFFPRFRRDVREQLHGAVAFAARLDPRGQNLVVAPPTMPRSGPPPSLAAYAAARARGDAHPGATSFRADIDLYCAFNRDEVERQARNEGLTVDEVKELTYFGFVAMRTTQAQKIEDVLHRHLTGEETAWLDRLVNDENDDFARSMHKLVDDGAVEADRWRLIHGFEDDYAAKLEQELGMTADQFDALLAPDPDGAGGPPVPLDDSLALPPPTPDDTPTVTAPLQPAVPAPLPPPTGGSGASPPSPSPGGGAGSGSSAPSPGGGPSPGGAPSPGGPR